MQSIAKNIGSVERPFVWGAWDANHGINTFEPVLAVLEWEGLQAAVSATPALLSRGWVERLRLFNCHCALWSLTAFEKAHPEERQPRMSLAWARGKAMGKISQEQFNMAWVVADEFANQYANEDFLVRHGALAPKMALHHAPDWVALPMLETALCVNPRQKARVVADLTREFVKFCRGKGEYGKVKV